MDATHFRKLCQGGVRISPNFCNIEQEKLIIAIFGHVGKACNFTDTTLQPVIFALHVERIERYGRELVGKVLDNLVMVRGA
jgi:hypothetical protein